MPDQQVILSTRLALTAAELARALGVSERLVRSLQTEIPHFWMGSRIRFPLDAVREWLKAQATKEGKGSGTLADEMLSDMQGES